MKRCLGFIIYVKQKSLSEGVAMNENFPDKSILRAGTRVMCMWSQPYWQENKSLTIGKTYIFTEQNGTLWIKDDSGTFRNSLLWNYQSRVVFKLVQACDAEEFE